MKVSKIIITGLLLSVISISLEANALQHHKWVEVDSSEPIYKTVNVRMPYDEIVTKSYNVSVPCGGYYETVDNNSLGIDTIIGAGIGMAIGNQIGRGDGRIAAKIVGGLLGANIANNQRQSSYNTKYCNETKYKDEIVTRYDYVEQKKLQGYKNTFHYKGETYTKITNYPKKRIRISTRISY